MKGEYMIMRTTNIFFTRNKRVLYALIPCLALLLAASCSKKKTMQSQRQQGPVIADVFVVQPQSVSESVEVPGTLRPDEETEIRPEVSGRVVSFNIPEGAIVQKGALLVKLFDGDLQTQLKKLEVQLQIAQKTEERQRELLAIKGISQQDYDLTALNVENLKIDIEATKIAIDKTEIRAPYTGKLGLRYVSVGAFVSSTNVLTSIRRVDQIKLEFAVPEKYARSIAKGFKVRFKVDGGEQFHDALVIATENSVDETTRTLLVRALVTESHPELVPGIFARVSLQLGQSDRALMIPTQAVIPQARDKQVILYRSDTAVYTVVETGIRDSAYVQITNGIEPGDTVIISGLLAIRPNARVQIANVHQYN